MPSKSATQFPIWTKLRVSLLQMFAIVEADMRKLRHDPFELFTRMVQPAIWLLIFGQAMAKMRVIPTGELSYLDFMAPGILAQSVLFISIFFSIALIWERDMGVLHKILVTPAPRVLLVLGRSVAAGIRSVSQIFIIYLLSFLLGIHLRFDIPALIGILAMVMLGGAIFATLSLIVACVVKKRERFMGIGQLITMPLFFASNALYPLDMMPTWLQRLSIVNPLTYQVDALRYLMIVGETSHFGLWVDFSVGFLILGILLAIATPLYPKILY
jgi:ABC-2 type transport system permease protein